MLPSNRFHDLSEKRANRHITNQAIAIAIEQTLHVATQRIAIHMCARDAHFEDDIGERSSVLFCDAHNEAKQSSLCRCVHRAHHPKINQPDAPILLDQDVAWMRVSVKEA